VPSLKVVFNRLKYLPSNNLNGLDLGCMGIPFFSTVEMIFIYAKSFLIEI
jgi:hypothetical protein